MGIKYSCICEKGEKHLQCKAEKHYIYCHACSKAGGADMPIYHEEPVCEEKRGE